MGVVSVECGRCAEDEAVGGEVELVLE